MEESQRDQTSKSIPMLNQQQTESLLNSNVSDCGSHGFFILESSPVADLSVSSSSSGLSVSSDNWSPFSPQFSQSYMWDLHHSSSSSSPLSGSLGVADSSELQHPKLNELEMKLLGHGSDLDYGSSFSNVAPPQSTMSTRSTKKILENAFYFDLKQLLVSCAEAVANVDKSTAEALMNLLEDKVSVSGEPIERLGAYMMECLRARLLSSGSKIYTDLKCNEPTGPELMSSMQVLAQICPYYKFAYTASNVIIRQAMEKESRIHIIDFQIAQGRQWIALLQAFARRPGGPPHVRVTGIDDFQSTIARGGGMDLVGQQLTQVAESCGVPFEFHGAAISGDLVNETAFQLQKGEAIAVNFPFMLHHIPDRDSLIKLVKGLSPKVVTLVEQESNTNTLPFFPRFFETLDYYTAMFESIDASGLPRDDKKRISAEKHCVARDIVNIIACEDVERVERHESFVEWNSRFYKAGFVPWPLNDTVSNAIKEMLRDYSANYRLLVEAREAICLGWKKRPMATFSAWR